METKELSVEERLAAATELLRLVEKDRYTQPFFTIVRLLARARLFQQVARFLDREIPNHPLRRQNA